MSDEGMSDDTPKTKRMEPWSRGAGIKITKADWEQTRADLDWWADLADALGCTVSGFTYRNHAGFNSGKHSHEISGWLATRLIARLDAAERERDALRDALRPFADMLDALENLGGMAKTGAWYIAESSVSGPREITFEHFHAARAALTANHSAPVVGG